jgi:DNA-binding NarL/FixJ family response regulator
LSSDPEIQVVGELNNGSELAKLVHDKQPDVLVLDLNLGEAFEPITTVRNLIQSNPKLQILVLTGYDDIIWMRSLIEAGALGYILKNDDVSMQLCRAVKAIYGGQPFYSEKVVHKLMTVPKQPDLLSNQELAILRLVATGINNSEIAEKMNISDKRVRNILSNIYTKLDVRGEGNQNQRMAAAIKARELGLLIDP